MDDENPEINEEKMSVKPLNASDVLEISAWRNKKLLIIKPLIPLRIAQILWAGSNQILAIFFFVILKQRGLTLLELSSVFSVTFLFQFAFASICGVVADKIGSAKPVLLFCILSLLSVIICILLAPEMRRASCTTQEIGKTGDNSSESQTYQNFCSLCIKNNTNNLKIITDENISRNLHHSDMLEDFNSFINNNGSLENYTIAFYINTTLCFKNCSELCKVFQMNTNNCFTRKDLLLVIYSIIIVCMVSLWSAVNRFFDFVALSLATEYGSNFGKEALISNFGEIFIVSIAAFALNIDTSVEERINYNLAYWCCAVVLVLTFISAFYIKNVKVAPGRKLKKKAWKLIRNIDILAFLIVAFVIGNGFNFNSSFNLWFLENLNASKTVMGLYSLTSSLYGIVSFLTAKWWLARFGTNKIFVLSLLAYTVNEFGYSILYNPWLSLILETTIVFSLHLMWVALVIHCRDVAPEGFAATMNAAAGTVIFGIGKSTGVAGGGLLMNYFGARTTYRIFSCICFVTAVFYSIFLCMRHKTARKKVKNDESIVGEQTEEMKHMNVRNEDA